MTAYHNIPNYKLKEDKPVIEKYSRRMLATILSYFSHTDYDEVYSKNHINYLDKYFKKKNVISILVEYPYIDKDYLEDYSAYYARSYSDYKKRTIRLHFFRKGVTMNVINNHLNRKQTNHDRLQKAYVGYMVVRPIPKTMIGKTVIETYPDKKEEGRIYPVKRKYHTHLFGIELQVDTIGYQEQDNAVAACATSALWSIFQSTAFLFQHKIPSPAEITRMATEHSTVPARSFPSKGLTIEQIAGCVKQLQLETQYHDAYTYNILKGYIKAYLNAQIPVFLGVSLFDNIKKEFLGEHALAVNGFSGTLVKSTNYFGQGCSDQRLYLRSSRINKIFVHDDQVGPFARMEFDDPFNKLVCLKGNEGTAYYSSLSTDWNQVEQKPTSVRAVPNTVLITLYHKIRIPFDEVLEIVAAINEYLNDFSPVDPLIDEWDILLDRNSEYKKKLLGQDPGHPSLSGDYATSILTKSLPRFFWRALAYKDDIPLFEIIFDATDISEGKLFLDLVCYDFEYCDFFYRFMKNRTRYSVIENRQARHSIGLMMNILKKMFGSSR